MLGWIWIWYVLKSLQDLADVKCEMYRLNREARMLGIEIPWLDRNRCFPYKEACHRSYLQFALCLAAREFSRCATASVPPFFKPGFTDRRVLAKGCKRDVSSNHSANVLVLW